MTATPGASKRLATAGGSEDGQVLAPKGVHKADAQTATSQSRFGTTPTDVITPSGDFNAGGMTMDLRGGVEVITLTGFAGTDSFTITFQEADGTKVTTAAIVRGTNAAASDVQTAIRAALTGTDLTTVSGTTDEGPFTVTYDRSGAGTRRFPKIVAITGTGCTGAVTRTKTPASRLGQVHLGESYTDGDGNTLTGPAIGTITVTDATHEVQTLTPGAGVDGGTVVLGFRRGASSAIAWDANVTAIQAAIDAMFTQVDDKLSNVSGTDSPVVTITGTEVVTIDFGDMSTADTCKLTYGSTESTTTLTYDAAMTAAQVQVLVNEAAGAGVYTVARTSNLVYTLTKQSAGVGSTWSVTSTATFTPKGTGGYTAGALITTAFSPSAGQAVWTFTFSRGFFHGKPVRGGLQVRTNSFTDGGVADTATIAVGTPGVLGSASAAYTELATYGDSVLAVAVNDSTGVEYSNGTGGAALLDAASPVVISSLPPGSYTLYARTYDTESQRLGPASSKTFTVA